MQSTDDPKRYRTLVRRFVASLIDTVVLVPLVLVGTLQMIWWPHFVYEFVLSTVIHFATLSYFVVLHARFGQTLGKRCVGVRVLSVSDEQPINWKAAVLRERPWILYAIIFTLHDLTVVVQNATDSPLPSLTTALDYLALTQFAWILADMGCTLFNEKRRSLHDFIGGTVVVRTG